MKNRLLDILVSIAWVLLGILLIYWDISGRQSFTIGGASILGMIMIVVGIVPAKDEKEA